MSTRERIVAATTELFRAHGYRGTSLADVSRAAGAPTGSLYHFFPGGKAALGAAVLRESGAGYLDLFDLITAEVREAGGGLAEEVDALFQGAATHLEETAFIEIRPIGSVAREMAGADEAIRRATSEVFDLWVAHLGERLEAAGVPAAEAVELSTTVIAALEGAFTLVRSHRRAEAVRATGRQIRRLVELQLAAASPTAPR